MKCYAHRDPRHVLHVPGWARVLNTIEDWLCHVPQWDPDPGVPLPTIATMPAEAAHAVPERPGACGGHGGTTEDYQWT